MEMVKELEISDWDPFDIANMINREISALLPYRWQNNYSDSYNTFSYQDDDGEDEPHFRLRSFSSCSSLQESIPDLVSKVEEISRGYYSLHGMSSLSIRFLSIERLSNALHSFSGFCNCNLKPCDASKS